MVIASEGAMAEVEVVLPTVATRWTTSNVKGKLLVARRRPNVNAAKRSAPAPRWYRHVSRVKHAFFLFLVLTNAQ